jgi:pyruvate, water dikinase
MRASQLRQARGSTLGYSSDGICWLGDDDCHVDAVVGGKAASLSRLAAAHRVPPGFAIAAVPARTSDVVDALAAAIEQSYGKLGKRCGDPDPPVAVRSSAVDEDGCDASFAGQHDTYLNIRGFEPLVDAVRRCVASASTKAALAYRMRRGLPVDDVRMAVLVQQLVPADVSAVAFSANPISGDRGEVMINSNWGLGESIVSGTATPDTFVVRKDDRRVISRDVARKDRMTVMLDCGTAEDDVPESLRSVCSLNDSQIAEITHLVTRLERDVGHAVDVELAFSAETLYLLQCRPITTLG